MANIKTVWDNKKSDIPKDHEMFSSQGGQSGTGVLRPVKGPNKKAAQEDPDYLNKMMSNQRQQGIQSANKFEDAIYIYKNGYKIGNEPFKDATNNEENKKFLQQLNNGEIPQQLEQTFKAKFGDNANDLEVKVVNKKSENYEPPKEDKKKVEAFSGQAHSMVDDSKKDDMNQSFDTVKPEKINFNAKNPNAKVQIVLIGGKREQLQVNHTTTVLEIYANVKLLSGYDGKFSLSAGFPPKVLNDPKQTVSEANLMGARIMQKKV